MFTTLPRFSSLDAVQHWALRTLLAEADHASPRGLPTREIIAGGFCLTQPRARRISNSARGWRGALAIGEFAWHLSGSTEVAPIAYYAPRWREFSEDGQHIRGSCYGSRIFGKEPRGRSQWELLVDLLKSDQASRRAVLSMLQQPEETLSHSSIDVPCVTSCQFLVRDDLVHAVVKMRSNDVIWGLPYDVFLFSMMQELLACELGLGLGSYLHMAGSLHLYERHVDLANRIVNSHAADSRQVAMEPMADAGALGDFLEFERELRTTGSSGVALAPYWANLADPLIKHAENVRVAAL